MWRRAATAIYTTCGNEARRFRQGCRAMIRESPAPTQPATGSASTSRSWRPWSIWQGSAPWVALSCSCNGECCVNRSHNNACCAKPRSSASASRRWSARNAASAWSRCAKAVSRALAGGMSAEARPSRSNRPRRSQSVGRWTYHSNTVRFLALLGRTVPQVLLGIALSERPQSPQDLPCRLPSDRLHSWLMRLGIAQFGEVVVEHAGLGDQHHGDLVPQARVDRSRDLGLLVQLQGGWRRAHRHRLRAPVDLPRLAATV